MKKKFFEIIYIAVTLIVFVVCYQNTKASEAEKDGKVQEQNLAGVNSVGSSEENKAEKREENTGSSQNKKQDSGIKSDSSIKQDSGIKQVDSINHDNTGNNKDHEENTGNDNPGQSESGGEKKPAKDLWADKGILPAERPLIEDDDYREYDNTEYAWWITRKENHEPSGSGAGIDISKYGAIYLDMQATNEDKVIYLTFDCGYENGNTPAILEALKEAGATATFFVTKSFVTSNPDLIRQIKAEGHNIGNHTVRHLSTPSLSPSELQKELTEVEEAVKEVTQSLPDAFFRPPSGDYSERVLKVLQDMGYNTVFWSIAYFDYDTENQPGEEFVVDHFNAYHHSGAIPLIHNTSVSNRIALPQVLSLLKEEGYRFGNLKELVP